MNLPLVDVFSTPYEAWSTRSPTYEERLECFEKTGSIHCPDVNIDLKAYICNALNSAKYIANVGADGGLGNFINDFLDRDSNFKTWRSNMPSITPQVLANYQQRFPNCDFTNVDFEINNIGHSLSNGQYLFHGGIWQGGSSTIYKTKRPLSTSFCPQVALRNSEHREKAYNDSQIDLLALRVTNPKTNIFSFRRKGTNMGHENEVLFASGAELVMRSRTLIRTDYLVAKYNSPNKNISIYVLEVDIS